MCLIEEWRDTGTYCPECFSKNPPEALFCEDCGCPFNKKSKSLEERPIKGRYKLISPLSSGGTGKIFLAYDIHMNKSCAVKEIYEEGLINLSHEEKNELLKPFEQEARLLAGLRHPNLPCVTDYFTEKNHCYLVMDYIKGKDLDMLLDESGGGLEEKEVIEWAIQICRVLEYLHNQEPSIVHGDIKTSNLIIRNEDGFIMLVDFGTASLLTDKGENEPVGTVGYAPPEQYFGEQETRSDIYSLGVTLYELLSGILPEEPFDFPSIRLFVPEITKDTERIIKKCISYNVKDRFNNATELKKAFLKAYKENFGSAQNEYKTTRFFTKKELSKKMIKLPFEAKKNNCKEVEKLSKEITTTSPQNDDKVFKSVIKLPAEKAGIRAESDIFSETAMEEKKDNLQDENEKLTALLIDLESIDASIRKKAIIELAKCGDKRAIIALKEVRKKEGPLSFIMKMTIDRAIKKLSAKEGPSMSKLLLAPYQNSNDNYCNIDDREERDVKGPGKDYKTVKLPAEEMEFDKKYETNKLPEEKITFEKNYYTNKPSRKENR